MHEIGAVLARDPDNWDAQVFMSFAAVDAGEIDQGLQAGHRAVELDPDASDSWFALARAQFKHKGSLDASEASVRRAIELDPEDVRCFGLLAFIHGRRKRWSDMLAAAEEGLAVEVDDDACINARAQALTQLGRSDEAAAALQGQLNADPDDAGTHANLGWTQLRQGDHRSAQASFREALRIDPSLDWARSGLAESLKANHWFYKPVLKFALWASSLTPRAQLFILIGGYIGYRMAMSAAPKAGPLEPVLWAVVAGYIGFVLLTWFASPISTCLLSFHPDGRLTFDRRERRDAQLLCALLATGIGVALWGWATENGWLPIGLASVLLCAPLHIALSKQEPRPRRAMLGYTGLVAVLVIAFAAVQVDLHGKVTKARPSLVEFLSIHAAYDELEREGQAAKGDSDTEVTQIGERLAEIRNRHAEFNAAHPNFETDVDAIKNQRSIADSLMLAVAILAFWVSQLVSAGIDRRYATV